MALPCHFGAPSYEMKNSGKEEGTPLVRPLDACCEQGAWHCLVLFTKLGDFGRVFFQRALVPSRGLSALIPDEAFQIRWGYAMRG